MALGEEQFVGLAADFEGKLRMKNAILFIGRNMKEDVVRQIIGLYPWKIIATSRNTLPLEELQGIHIKIYSDEGDITAANLWKNDEIPDVYVWKKDESLNEEECQTLEITGESEEEYRVRRAQGMMKRLCKMIDNHNAMVVVGYAPETDNDMPYRAFATAVYNDCAIADNIQFWSEKSEETKLKKLLQRRVWLDNGAYLMIDYTEALTVIDVNTGKFTGDYDLHKTILRTNLSAAKEIARQLRLRAIGGIIVIDFIDMETDEERTAVLKALEEAAAGDRIKTNILGFAPLGLVEVTRKKTRLSLADSMQRLCPYCEGDGRILNEKTIVNSLLFELERCVKNHETACAVLRLNPYISAALKQQNDILREHFSDISIFVREDMSMHVEDYNITPIRKGEEMADREGLVRVL